MGMSADAHLFYGYVWTDEDHLTEDDYETSERGKERYSVEVGWHGSIDYSQPYVYISESVTRAYWGSPKPVDPAAVNVSDATLAIWNERLSHFIAEHNINLLERDEWSKAPQGPGWFLVSSYG